MAVRKAETVYLGDASSVVRATQAAQAANAAYAAKVQATAEQIIAAQDRVAAAGKAASDAALKQGDSASVAAAKAGRASLDQAKAVGQSTAQQVAAYRTASDAALRAAAEQEAAAKKAADAQVSAGEKIKGAAAASASAVGGWAKKAGEALAATITGSVWAAVKFQKNMELIHTQAGATTVEVQKMSKAVLELGLSTEQGPNALAKALYPIESVGLRGADAIAALGAAAKGAAVGQSDLTETTHALAGVMVALHENGKQAADTMAAIDAVVGVGKMTMQDFVDALSSGIVPTAHAVGLSFRSLAAGLATMTDAGVPAEQAATKMRTILLMLAHEHTKEAVSNLKDMGLTADDLANAMRKPGNGLLDVLKLLHDRMAGLSPSKQVDILSSLAGGSRSAGTLITLIQNLDRVGQKYQMIGNLTGQFNSRVTAESETASHRIKVAWSQIQVAFISLGSAILPTVSKVLGAIEKFVQEMAKGVGAGGAFKNAIVSAFTFVKTTVGNVVSAVNGFLESHKAEVNSVIRAVNNVKDALVGAWQGYILPMFQRVLPGIKAIVQGAFTAIQGIVNTLSGILTLDFGRAWEGVKQIFSGALQVIGGIIRAATAPFRQGAAMLGSAIASGISSAVNAIVKAVTSLIDAGVNSLKQYWNALYNIGKWLIHGLTQGVSDAASGLLDTVKSVVTAPISLAKSILGIGSPSKVFHQIGLNIVQGLVGGLVSNQQLIADGLNTTLLYPVDAAIAALQARKAQLQAQWAAIDSAAQRSSLVAAIAAAQAQGSGGGTNVPSANLVAAVSGGRVSGSVGGFSAGQNATARSVFGVLTAGGLSRAGAAAMVGNWAQESSLNENEPGGLLAQWGGSRLAALLSRFGSHPTAAQQAAFALSELSQYPGLLAMLKTTTDPRAAALAISQQYERPAAWAANNPNREDQAAAFYAALSGGGPSTSTKVIRSKTGTSTVQTGTASQNAVAQAIQALKDFDTQAKRAQLLAKIDLKITNLQQLDAFKNAIAGLYTQVKDLASQAAQAWRSAQETAINATHDTAITAIGNSPAAQQLAAMQAQDAATQVAQQRAQLTQAVTDAQFQVAHSAGTTHTAALQQLQQAQDALTAFERQQDEQRLQDQIDAATKAADVTQQTALSGLDKQQADYQAFLTAGLTALTDNLNARKITYAVWAKDVNAILAQYGLSASTDPTTEAAVTAGPGSAGTPAKKSGPDWSWGWGKYKGWGGARAAGGSVQPGYVYRVGEQGPEDVMFGARGTVLNASETRRRNGGNVHIEHFHAHGVREARAFADRIAFRAAIGTP